MGKRIDQDARQEKWYHASVWVGLAVVAFMVLCYTSFQFGLERYLIKNGSCVVAEYTEKTLSKGNTYKVASYAEDGKIYRFDLNAFYPVTNGNKVKLYYKNNIETAVPENVWWIWAQDYFIFGSMLAFNIWRIWANYRKPYYVRHQIPELEV